MVRHAGGGVGIQELINQLAVKTPFAYDGQVQRTRSTLA